MKNKQAMAIVLQDLGDTLVTERGHICALGELVTEANYYSAHHIDPVRNGGVTKPSNIIPLSNISHTQFNFIEARNCKMAKDINDGFIELKETKNGLIIAQLHVIKNELLERYEYGNRRSRTKRR